MVQEFIHFEKILDDLYKSMVAREEPYVIVMALCFSDRNQLTRYMGELGIIAACSMKQERGEITKGRWFKLDEGQEEILRKVRNYHKSRSSMNLKKSPSPRR